jgi:hypothetical protein
MRAATTTFEVDRFDWGVPLILDAVSVEIPSLRFGLYLNARSCRLALFNRPFNIFNVHQIPHSLAACSSLGRRASFNQEEFDHMQMRLESGYK